MKHILLILTSLLIATSCTSSQPKIKRKFVFDYFRYRYTYSNEIISYESGCFSKEETDERPILTVKTDSQETALLFLLKLTTPFDISLETETITKNPTKEPSVSSEIKLLFPESSRSEIEFAYCLYKQPGFLRDDGILISVRLARNQPQKDIFDHTESESGPTVNSIIKLPNLDCEKASKYAEKEICTDNWLAEASLKMNEMFSYLKTNLNQQAIKYISNVQDVTEKQINACSNKQCLYRVHHIRLNQLFDLIQKDKKSRSPAGEN